MSWYQMQIDKWRNSPRVAEMNAAERGIYRELLDCQFTHPEGYLPNVPDSYWQFARCTPDEWSQARVKVLAMFPEVEGGKYRSNETMREQWERAKEKYQTLAENGRKGGQKKAAALANALAPPEQTSSKTVADLDLDKEGTKKPLSDADASNASQPDVKAGLQAQLRGAVKESFGYYLSKTGRNPNNYALTDKRMDKGLLRLKEFQAICDGDLAKATGMMNRAIDGICSDDWEERPKYREWEKHLFNSQENAEKWRNAPLKRQPRSVSTSEGSSFLSDLEHKRAAAAADRGAM